MKAVFILFGVMVLAAGCASTSSSSQVAAASATTQPGGGAVHAECLVCKHNADLACVDVSVDGQTPRCVRNGETYYFCSDECRRAFEKNPAKYLSHSK